jgi:hypothetical protein
MDGPEILIAPRNSSGSDSSMLIEFENMLSPPFYAFPQLLNDGACMNVLARWRVCLK